MAYTSNVITTWKNKSQKPQERTFPARYPSNRDRIHNPNHLPYGPAHSEFYKLPYETREELRRARRTTQTKGILPAIAEDIDNNELNPVAKKFVSFHDYSPETIAKEDIEGKHFRKITHYRADQMNGFFENIPPLKRSSSFTEFLNEQENNTLETRSSRSSSF